MTKIHNGYRRLRPGAREAMRALWKDITKASRHLAWPETRRRRAVHAGGVSPAWLRANAIESAKHVDDS